MSVAAEERRLVTALFCDLVGFTPLSTSLDPEEVRDIQASYFAAMATQIERYGGTVEKYAGDAVLALFGAPIAHEDDAERAVLCALGMQEAIEGVARETRRRWHIEPAIRVGVNTGEVVSGTWAASGRQDVAVTGDAVNTAARIQAAAEPGEVLVGTETMRLTQRRIRYGDRRDAVLKGIAGPVPVYPALGLRDRLGERWELRDGVAPLIGRDREMMRLRDAWMRAQQGEGQFVTVIGEVGVGKSRLVAEGLDTIAARAAIRVLRARCLSYGQSISLWLVADLLRSLLGLPEQAGATEVREGLTTMVPALLGHGSPDAQAEAIDVLGEVLGLPVGNSPVTHAGAQVRRQALIRSLKAMLHALAERAPSVVVMEDAHWMDDASRDVLSAALADVPGLRLLVLVAQRPGWSGPWSEWGWTERITLRPLAEGEAAVLARAVLGTGSLAPELEQYVAERAGGNPFFVEELLRALQESGGLEQREGTVKLVPGAAARLPSTLTEVLQARLDRLDPEARVVAQVGSVIGRSFAVRLLAEVVGQAAEGLEVPLAQLQRAEIAFPGATREPEYVFKHVTLRDAAYHTMIQRRRAELHLQTARAIAALYPVDEYVEIIAYHYGRTDAPEAAGWLERAGDRAAAMHATAEALDHYNNALRRVSEGSSEASEQTRTIARLEEKIGTALLTSGSYDQGLDHLGKAAAIAREQRDLESAGRVTAQIGMGHRYRGTPEEGIALVTPMIDLLSWSGPSEALAALYLAQASLYVVLGRYREIAAVADRAAEIAGAIGNTRLAGEALERRAIAHRITGHPVEAIKLYRQAIPLIEAGGDLAVLWRALNNAGDACLHAGRAVECREYWERALTVAERAGNPDVTAFLLSNIADLLVLLGDWDEATATLRRGMAMTQHEESPGASGILVSSGLLLLRRGDWQAAEGRLVEAESMCEKVGQYDGLAQARAGLAELEILSGRPEAAHQRLSHEGGREATDRSVPITLAWAELEAGHVEAAADHVDDIVRESRDGGESIYLPEALRVQGMVLRRQGRIEEAAAVLEEALALAKSLPTPYVEARVLEQLALLAADRGQPADSEEYRTTALAIYRRLGAQKDVERLEVDAI